MTEKEILNQRLHAIEQSIANYEELGSDLGAPEYVARGNGFCDSKYSEDFIEGQLEKLRQERDQLEAYLVKL